MLNKTIGLVCNRIALDYANIKLVIQIMLICFYKKNYVVNK